MSSPLAMPFVHISGLSFRITWTSEAIFTVPHSIIRERPIVHQKPSLTIHL